MTLDSGSVASEFDLRLSAAAATRMRGGCHTVRVRVTVTVGRPGRPGPGPAVLASVTGRRDGPGSVRDRHGDRRCQEKLARSHR